MSDEGKKAARLRSRIAQNRTDYGKKRAFAESSTDWKIVLSDGKKEIVTSSREMRQKRSYRRVHRWATVIKSIRAQSQVSAKSGKRIDQSRMLMVTLTYRKQEDYRKNDIREFMLIVRSRLKSKLLAYAWVAEMQSRGVIHYHVLLLLKRGTKIPYPDKAGWWLHGHTNVTEARSPYYIVTYIGKQFQKDGLPKHCRMFAVWIDPKLLSLAERLEFKLSSIPIWVENVIRLIAPKFDYIVKWTKPKGGGYLIEQTGKLLKSGFRLLGFYK